MNLTEDQIRVLRESYELIVPEIDRISELFYQDLFGRIPQVRSLFHSDMSEQGMRFMSAIGVIVENLDNPEAMNAEVEKIARGHAAFHIKPAWYREMQEALIDTLCHALKAKFTNEVELAWRAAFEQICDRMAEVAEADRS